MHYECDCWFVSADVPPLWSKRHLPPDVECPSPGDFWEGLRRVQPDACALDSKFVRLEQTTPEVPTVGLPQNKIQHFFAEHICDSSCTRACSDLLVYQLHYTDEEMTEIEVATRGQASNTNWHKARVGLLTASNFHRVCHCNDGMQTAGKLLEDSKLHDDCLPASVAYGRQHEETARQMFLKSHRYHHRSSTITVPGLTLNSNYPYLGCSADGILNCKSCGRFIVEVKCMFANRNFHPKVAAVMQGICKKNDSGELELLYGHKYFYQIQGQMALTSIHKAFLVLYTNKGIASVPVLFDEDFWESCSSQLCDFYHSYMYRALHQKYSK